MTDDDIALDVSNSVAELDSLSQLFAEQIIGGQSNFTQLYDIETLENYGVVKTVVWNFVLGLSLQ